MRGYRWMKKILSFFAVLQFIAPLVAALAADPAISSLIPDSSFGKEGNVELFTQSGPDDAYVAHALHVQADGKTLWAGRRVVTTHKSVGCGDPTITEVDVFVTRYLPDGTVDKSFGREGTALAGLAGNEVRVASVTGITVQPDGNIVVSGLVDHPTTYTRNFLLVRYTADGELETVFDGFSNGPKELRDRDIRDSAAVRQKGAKIVLAGTTHIDGFYGDFTLIRHLSDGRLDQRFGRNVNGIVTTSFNHLVSEDADTASAYERVGVKVIGAAADGNDGIVVAGYSEEGEIALTRYTENGRPDFNFGRFGRVLTRVPEMRCVINGLKVMPDGSIWVTGKATAQAPSEGEANASTSDHLLLAHYDASGQLDTGFGRNGVVRTDFGGFEGINVFPLQTGQLLVAAKDVLPFRYEYSEGTAGENGDMAAVACYDSQGGIVESFGENGLWRREEDGYSPIQTILYTEMPSEGKILLAGRSSKLYYFRKNKLAGQPVSPYPGLRIEQFVPVPQN